MSMNLDQCGLFLNFVKWNYVFFWSGSLLQLWESPNSLYENEQLEIDYSKNITILYIQSIVTELFVTVWGSYKWYCYQNSYTYISHT
jgi:hypothetical protein